MVFGAPRINGKLTPPHALKTREAIGRWIRHRRSEPLAVRLSLTERFDAAAAKDLWSQYVRKGWEGLILGGPQGLARMKQAPTYDYVCMGFEASDSDRYAGRGVRSVRAGLYRDGKLQYLTSISGLTDQQRRDFHSRPQDYVGRVFEAEGKLLFPSGKLRHPNFLRWRDDKRPEDCRPPKKI